MPQLYEKMFRCALRRRAFPSSRRLLQIRIAGCRYAHIIPSAKPFSEVPKITSFPIVKSSWIYLPLVGRYRRLDLNQAALNMHRQYGPLVVEDLPGRNSIVHLFSAHDIRTLYLEEKMAPYRMGGDPFRLYHDYRPEYFANCGILNAQGQQWKKIRNMGQPCILRPHVVESFAERIDQVTDDVVRFIASHRDEKGDVAGCYEILTRWALETIVYITLGRRVGLLEHQLRPDSEAARIMHEISAFLDSLDTLVTHFPYYRYFLTPTCRRLRKAGDIIAPFFFHLTKEAADAAGASSDKIKKSTIVEHLWSDNLQLKEMFTFLHDIIFTGIVTTAAMATYTLFCLAMNPNAQEEARKEVATLPEKVLRSSGALPYVTACVKEALRLYPIVPGINIKLTQDIVLSGYQIPANVVLRTEQFVAGRLEENFNRASEFLPQRWLRSPKQRHEGSASEEVLTMHPFGSLPFSFGPRSCLGKRVAELEVCTLLAKVLRRYKVENHHGDIGFRTMTTAKPERPVQFRFLESGLV